MHTIIIITVQVTTMTQQRSLEKNDSVNYQASALHGTAVYGMHLLQELLSALVSEARHVH